jgi:hypothetical protein
MTVLEYLFNDYDSYQCCEGLSLEYRRVIGFYGIPEEGGIWVQYPNKNPEFFGTGNYPNHPITASVQPATATSPAKYPVWRFRSRNNYPDWTIRSLPASTLCNVIDYFFSNDSNGITKVKTLEIYPNYWQDIYLFAVVATDNGQQIVQWDRVTGTFFYSAELISIEDSNTSFCEQKCLFQIKDNLGNILVAKTSEACPKYWYQPCRVNAFKTTKFEVDLSDWVYYHVLGRIITGCVAIKYYEDNQKKGVKIYHLKPYRNRPDQPWTLGGPYVEILLYDLQAPYGCEHPLVSLTCYGGPDRCPPNTAYECKLPNGCTCCYDCKGNVIATLCS